MAKYTAKELRNITKDELVELLRKENIEFDKTLPFFTLRSLLLNVDENKNESETQNEEVMGRKKIVDEPIVENNGVIVENEIEKGLENEKPEPEVKNEPKAETEPEPNAEIKPEPKTEKPQPNKTSVFAAELMKRKSSFRKGMSAFAAELAKRKGERVTGTTFAQELKNRQMKYSK